MLEEKGPSDGRGKLGGHRYLVQVGQSDHHDIIGTQEDFAGEKEGVSLRRAGIDRCLGTGIVDAVPGRCRGIPVGGRGRLGTVLGGLNRGIANDARAGRQRDGERENRGESEALQSERGYRCIRASAGSSEQRVGLRSDDELGSVVPHRVDLPRNRVLHQEVGLDRAEQPQGSLGVGQVAVQPGVPDLGG